MQLLLLVIIAGAVGYFLATSRFRKNIDDTAGKVTESTKDVADSVEGWWQGLFGKRKQAGEEVVDADFVEDDIPSDEEKKTAKKSTSRRKAESEETTSEESSESSNSDLDND